MQVKRYENCGYCRRQVPFGTLYQVKCKHMCAWCYHSHNKGKKFSRKFNTWG